VLNLGKIEGADGGVVAERGVSDHSAEDHHSNTAPEPDSAPCLDGF
jgi:hypothetical protein